MQRKKKNKTIVIVATILIVILAGIIGVTIYDKIKSNQSISVSTDLYFLETSTSLMKTEKRDIKGESNKEILDGVIKELKSVPKTEGYTSAIPKDVTAHKISIDERIVTADLSSEYANMKAGEELQCRASIVWSMTALDFVDKVIITIDGKELTKANGEPMGAMGREDIVIDNVIPTEPTNNETVKLYFSNEDATGLDVEERTIIVNPNQPIERYVVEELIKGPSVSGLYATVPSETKIREIKTVDAVCYVDLSNEFVTKHGGGSTGEALTIYSIVNSLTQVQGVSKVQFLIEGEKMEAYKGHLDFGKPFEYKDIDI